MRINFNKITVVVLFLFFVNTQNILADTIRDGSAVSGEDYTVFRTVNVLSCHPQNPNLPEVPHLIGFDFNGLPSSFPTNSVVIGYCATIHTERDPRFIGISAATYPSPNDRPPVPWRHYVVIEVPNLNYNPANDASCRNNGVNPQTGTILQGVARFCGKYIHFEGPLKISMLAATADSSHTVEAWHWPAEWIGVFHNGYGGTKFELNRVSINYISPDGSTMSQAAGRFSFSRAESFFFQKDNVSSPTRPVKLAYTGNPSDTSDDDPSDTLLPRFLNVTLPMKPSNSVNAINPTYYADIPHNKFGDLKRASYTGWVKCRNFYPPEYFKSGTFGTTYEPNPSFNSATAQVRAFLPDSDPSTPSYDCDYDNLTRFSYQKINNDPTCLSPAYNDGREIDASMENCATTVISTPATSPTPSLTAPVTLPPLPGDIVPPNNVVDILDYDAVVSDFGQQGDNLRSDITPPQGSVDIFDYNKVVSNFGRTN